MIRRAAHRLLVVAAGLSLAAAALALASLVTRATGLGDTLALAASLAALYLSSLAIAVRAEARR